MGINLDFIITSLIIVFNLVIGILVIRKNSKSRINRYFALFVFWLSLFLATNFLENEPDIVGANIIEWMLRIDFVAAAFTVFFILLFSINFRSKKVYSLINPWIIPIWLLLIFLSIASLFSNLIIDGIFFNDSVITFDIGGIFWFVYAFFIIGCVLGSATILIYRYRKSVGITRIQTAYLLWGIIVSCIIAIVINIGMQPFFDISVSVSRIGIYSYSIFVLSAAYAIIRYRLMDVKTLLIRSLSYILFILILAGLYISLFFSAKFLFERFFNINSLTSFVVITSVILAVLFRPLKNLFDKATEKIIYRKKFKPQDLLNNLHRCLQGILEIKEILKCLTEQICDAFSCEKLAVVIITDKNKKFIVEQIGDFKISFRETFRDNKHLEKYLKKFKSVDDLVALDTMRMEIEDGLKTKRSFNGLTRKFERSDIALAIPICSNNRCFGFIFLGNKKSGDAYTYEDVQTLKLLIAQTSNFIENALLYRDIKKEKERLEKFHELTVGRELKMRELKGEINKLKNNNNNKH